MRLFGSLILLVAVYAWPVFSFVAFVMLLLDGEWSVIHYFLVASFFAHAPLAQFVRKKIVGEGEFAGPIDKLKMATPIFANMVVFIGLFTFLLIR